MMYETFLNEQTVVDSIHLLVQYLDTHNMCSVPTDETYVV